MHGRARTGIAALAVAVALAAPLTACAEAGQLVDGVRDGIEQAGEAGQQLVDRGRELAEQGEAWWNETGSGMFGDVQQSLESIIGGMDATEVQQTMAELCTLIQSDARRAAVERQALDAIEQATGVTPTDEQVNAVVDLAVAACGG